MDAVQQQERPQDASATKQLGVLQVVDEDSSQNDTEAFAGNPVQAGVREVEAIVSTWSRKSLITTYILIWVVYFVMLIEQAAASALNPYVTSAFQSHSLTSTVLVLSSVIGGVCTLPMAKVLDVFGRPHGYAVGLFITVIGLIMMAATTTVEMYAAAQVFFTVGNNALLYTVGIIVNDTTTLRNRGLMLALTASPNIITVWLGGPIAEGFLKGPGWRWCFGMFCLLVPVLDIPLLVLLFVNRHKAKRTGAITPQKTTERSFWQSCVDYIREFDAFGLLLLSAGLALFLLPFNLYGYQPQGWQSPLIICLLVFGLLLMVAFALWEKFLAPVKFLPFSLLMDRNMIGACLLGTVLFISYFCWASYFSSFLQVVNDLTVTEASYVVQIYGLGSSIFGIVTGAVIRWTGRFKPVTLFFAIPIYTLFMGLMIYFRTPDQDVGYIILCQIFVSLGAGVIVVTPPIAGMSASSHQHIAAVVAVISMFSSIGGAIGLTVAGAIWQDVFPKKLLQYLPPAEQENLFDIYASLDVQLSYPVGSVTRHAIQMAYADAQAMMLAAGTAIWAVGFLAVAMWRNTNVKDVKQVEGQIF